MMALPGRAAARIAGLTSLSTFAFVVFANFGILGGLIVRGATADTVRNIASHEQLFRLGIVSFLVYGAGLVVVLAFLYEALEPVHRGLALLAALFSLVYALAWIFMALDLLAVLRLLTRPEYLRELGAERLQAFVSASLGAGFEKYYVGLLFHAVGSTVFSTLLLRSRLIPKALAAAGVLANAWCAASTFAFILLPRFDTLVGLWWFDSPMVIFEVTFAAWLIFKGLKPLRIADTRGAQA
jgi:hypothetical protein